MLLEQIIKPDRVLCNARARSKKHCLEILSELLVRSMEGVSRDEVLASLIERERLGCTSLDKGVAFPHCRVDGIDSSVGAMLRLSDAVEFDSPDGEAVDLVFGLLVPADLDEARQTDVADIAELLGDDELRARLRGATTSSELYDALCD